MCSIVLPSTLTRSSVQAWRKGLIKGSFLRWGTWEFLSPPSPRKHYGLDPQVQRCVSQARVWLTEENTLLLASRVWYRRGCQSASLGQELAVGKLNPFHTQSMDLEFKRKKNRNPETCMFVLWISCSLRLSCSLCCSLGLSCSLLDSCSLGPLLSRIMWKSWAARHCGEAWVSDAWGPTMREIHLKNEWCCWLPVFLKGLYS